MVDRRQSEPQLLGHLLSPGRRSRRQPLSSQRRPEPRSGRLRAHAAPRCTGAGRPVRGHAASAPHTRRLSDPVCILRAASRRTARSPRAIPARDGAPAPPANPCTCKPATPARMTPPARRRTTARPGSGRLDAADPLGIRRRKVARLGAAIDVPRIEIAKHRRTASRAPRTELLAVEPRPAPVTMMFSASTGNELENRHTRTP